MVAALPLIMAGTSAIGAGLSLVDILTRDSSFEDAGPTGAQRQLLGLQTQNIERLQSQTGMTAADVQKVQQVQQGQQQQNMQAVNALQQSNLSAFDKQRIASALQSEIQRTQQRNKDVLSLLDVGQEAQRLSAASRATAQAANQAEQIRRAEIQKRQLMEQEKAARSQALQNIFGSLAKTAALGFASVDPNTAEALGFAGEQSAGSTEVPGVTDQQVPNLSEQLTISQLTPMQDAQVNAQESFGLPTLTGSGMMQFRGMDQFLMSELEFGI